MEFSLPTGYYPNVFPTYGQPNTFSTPSPFQYNACPEILGEGNVTSIISPDGSTQFLFMPTAQWWRPYSASANPNQNCYNPYLNSNNTLGVWLIRTIYNPIPQPTGFRPPYPIPCGFLNPRASASDCCLNLPVPGFALKFHNDKCTSTTDIQYFFPKHHRWLQKPRECTAVQVDASCGEVLCTKPCNCAPLQNVKCCCAIRDERKHKCKCIKQSHSSHSAMSIEESKSDLCCHKKNRSKKSHRLQTTSHAHFDNKKRSNSDKYVTTCAEQACGCVEEKGRETQTSCPAKCLLREVNSEDFIYTAELWKPKTPLSKRTFTINLSGTSGDVCTRCSSSNFSSNSDTELEL